MGQADGTATQTGGIQVRQLGVHLGVDFEQEILAFYLSDYVPGAQWLRILDALKSMGADVNSIQRVTVYGVLKAQLDLYPAIDPPPIHLQAGTFGFTFGAKAAYEPDLIVVKGSIYAGGEIGPEFQIAPTFAFNKITGKIYGGITFTAFLIKLVDEQFVLLNYSWPSSAKGLSLAQSSVNDGWVVVPVESNNDLTLDRGYLKAGEERFVGFDGAQATKSSNSRTVLLASDQMSVGVSALDAFRSIGRTASDPVGSKGGMAQPQNGPVHDAGPQVGQADLPLLENVFPGADPAMAGRGQELMLLYVTDNGSPNDLQFTDIRWTRFDGTNWSVPATIQTNTQAEFSPQVAYDGNGDAIAVWERVADPNFNQTNLPAMAAQMEIAWSRWNRTNGTWTEPVTLTTNSWLDHAPLLCGPMGNGDVLAVWTENRANLLMGTNAPGNDTVLGAEWNAANRNWGAPLVLVDGLTYRLSQSVAGAWNHAVYAWTRDADGVLTNDTDQEVFFKEYTNGELRPAQQFTTDTFADKNVRAAVTTNGNVFLVWQRGTNLVMSQDFLTDFTLVRADSQTAGFADYAMTVGPGGNLALLWQEMSQSGSDAHYRVLDPVSATWSKDAQLFNDPPLERSFAPVWDDVGNLTVAYNKVEIIYTNKTVTLEGGGTVTITNVPQPGRVDLCVTKRQLIKDVALAAGDFTVSAENYLPGAAVTLSATLRNAGDVAVSNAVVAFYDGNPTNGGVLITNVAISGWLEGAATNPVSALWVVPEPATNHVLYAVADPAGAITEFDEVNNKQSLSIGGTDLSVSLVSQTAETNGAVRVIAQVQNLGAPSATNSTLAIRRYGNTNAPLAAVAVPLLEPGRLAQVALDLPAGTQPEGEQVYTLRADDSGVTSDVDTNNNTSSFAVNLWIDSDGDGMPDGYEAQYAFLSSTNAADALLDYDGDGLSNLAEYRAGTAPNDPLSYLRMTGVGVDGTNGVLVAWGSATNKLYTVQRSSNLAQAFTNLVEHILSTPPENVFLDQTATDGAAQFYRVKLE